MKKAKAFPRIIIVALILIYCTAITAFADENKILVYSSQPTEAQNETFEAFLPQIAQDLEIILLERGIAVNDCTIGHPFETSNLYSAEKTEYTYPVLYQDTIVFNILMDFETNKNKEPEYYLSDTLTPALGNDGSILYFFKANHMYFMYTPENGLEYFAETPLLEDAGPYFFSDEMEILELMPPNTIDITAPLYPLAGYDAQTPQLNIYMDGQPTAEPAYFINGSYLVPAKLLAEQVQGVSLEWFGETKTLHVHVQQPDSELITRIIFTKNSAMASTYFGSASDYWPSHIEYAPMYIINGRAMIPADILSGLIKPVANENRLELFTLEGNPLEDPTIEYLGVGAWLHINQPLTKPESWRQIVEDTPFALGSVGYRDENVSYGSYPVIDGSTVNVPMGMEFAMQHLKMDLEDATYFTAFTTTHSAYENLILKRTEHHRGSGYIASKAASMTTDQPVDIILVTEPSDEELLLAEENGIELVIEPICYDAFVFITHKDNPVDSLTVEQIQKIYSGEITNWKEVGGPDMLIAPFQREKNSGSQTAMENMVMNGIPILEEEGPRDIPVVIGMGYLIQRVTQYQNSVASIGYTYKYYIDNLYKDENIKILQINSISPENENLYNNTYPFYTHYYGVIRQEDKDAAGGQFLAWLLSEQGQQCIEQAGYVPMEKTE